MSKPNSNADKAPQLNAGGANVPSIEQVEVATKETETIKEEVVPEQISKSKSETIEEVKSGNEKYPETVSIEMGFKEEVVPANPNDVKFKVKYRKDFEGIKRHIEGSVIIISKESAKMFEEKGIGQILK